jgi:DNA-binding IclR family transcriptional regulator
VSTSANPSAEIITVVEDAVSLVQTMASDFEPRTLNQLLELYSGSSQPLSRTKLYNLLRTLEHCGWATQDTATGQWRLAPQLIALSLSYHHYIQAVAQRAAEELNTIYQIAEKGAATHAI